MAGQYSCYRQAFDPLNGFPEKLWVCCRIKRIQASHIQQISGKEIPALRLIKATVSRGMARRVDHFQPPVSKIEDIPITQKPCRIPRKEGVTVYVKCVRKTTGLTSQILFHNRKRYRKIGKPRGLRFKNRNIVKMPVSANVIPVHMGCCGQYRKCGQALRHASDIGAPRPVSIKSAVCVPHSR